MKKMSTLLLGTALLGAAAALLLAMPLSAAELSAPVCTSAPALTLDLEQPVEMAGGVPCGGVTCPPKMECCNPTCNRCVFPGMSCTQEVCNDTSAAPAPEPMLEPIGPIEPEPCGLVFCPKGTTCCNPLCSACTPPGVSCTLGDCGHGGPSS